MAQRVFKNPGALAENLTKTPKFDKRALVSYLKNFGTGDTDVQYKEWATKKGKPLQGKPLDPEFLKTSFARQNYGDATETYADQYLNDDEWLQEVWPSYSNDALDWMNESSPHGYQPKDEDYERSWGPKKENE